MTPDLTEHGAAPAPARRARWCRALLRWLGLAGEDPPRMPDAAAEGARIEAAFFASYMDDGRR